MFTVIALTLAPFAVGAAAAGVRRAPAWRSQLVQLLLLGVFSLGWFVSRLRAAPGMAPAESFAGWFVVIAAPITVTFVVIRLTAGVPAWVAAALIGPTVFFITALIGVAIAVATGLARF